MVFALNKCNTHVDKPRIYIHFKLTWLHFKHIQFNLVKIFARSKLSAIRKPKNMSVDRNRGPTLSGDNYCIYLIWKEYSIGLFCA